MKKHRPLIEAAIIALALVALAVASCANRQAMCNHAAGVCARGWDQ